jgi:mercuric ion transport protein
MAATPLTAGTKSEGTRSVWLSLGALGSALGVFASWLCCLFPLALGALGMGASALGTRLEPFRPYLLALTAVFLGTGFYQVYKRPKRECSDDKICARPKGRRIQITLLWIITVLAAILVSAPYWAAIYAQWGL